MASPFRFFRKHQKAFLVIAAVIAMFVFVVGDALTGFFVGSMGGQRGRSVNTTVASWDGGSLTLGEVDNLTQRRIFISQFLMNLYMTAASELQAQGETPPNPTVPNFILPQDSTPQQVQENVITTRIMAEQAREAGMNVSDQVILNYLHDWGLGRVSSGEIAEILRQMSQGTRLRNAEEQLFSGLRELLLSTLYFQSYTSSVQSVLPEERWQDWLKINERISLEAAVLPAESFLSEVPDPSDAQIAAFYEQHKDDIAGMPHMVMGTQLPSPTPGFRQPRKVKLKYLVGDVEAWTQKYLDTITEEAIVDYYERNKRTHFVEDESQIQGAMQDEMGGQEPFMSDTETELFGDQPATEPDAAATENAAETEDAAETDSTDPSPNPEETPSESDAEPPADPAESPDENETGRTSAASPFRLAALQLEEPTETPADETTESEEPAESAPPADENTSALGEETAAEDQQQAASPEVDQPESEAELQQTPDDASEEAPPGDAAEQASEDTEEEVSYVPLEEVRDLIRRRLATDKAVVELQEVVEQAYSELVSSYNPYGFSVSEAEAQGEQPPPPPEELTNLEQIAEETGLEANETVLLSQLELVDTYVGKAMEAQSQMQPVFHEVFDERALYEPFLAQDVDGHWYIVLKVEDVPSRVPPLEEIRDEVVQAWKEQQAAELALERAEQLAQQAEEAGKTLDEFFSDKQFEAVTTDMFSWWTFGMEIRRGPRLGEAPPLDAVGPEFMEQVFDLESGEVIALHNYDHSKAYVVRLHNREHTKEELRNLFLTEANTWYGAPILMQVRMQNARQELQQELIERVGLDTEQLNEFLQSESE